MTPELGFIKQNELSKHAYCWGLLESQRCPRHLQFLEDLEVLSVQEDPADLQHLADQPDQGCPVDLEAPVVQSQHKLLPSCTMKLYSSFLYH